MGCSDAVGGPQRAAGGSAGTAGSGGNGGAEALAGGAGSAASGAGASTGGTAGNGGSSPVTPIEGMWPTYEEAAASPLSTKTLVILLDFADTDADALVPNAEAAWAQMIFGTEQGQGNHYWYETSGGRFQLLRAEETQGTANDGLVRHKVSAPKPVGSSIVTETQPWLFEALDALATSVDFEAFDSSGDGVLTNDELSVLLIVDVEANVLAYADAQANIQLSYPITGTGVTLDKFTRSLAMMSSIGVPMHELGHHIFDLDHFMTPSDHDLMGMGSYAEDPSVGNLHNPSYRSGTRPTGLHGFNAQRLGFANVTKLSDTARGVELHSPELGQHRNVIELPVMNGFVYVENRTSWGYDASIPFCEGSSGGLFVTEISQYVGAVNVPGVRRNLEAVEFFEGELDFCEYYSHAGHNDSFEFGGWRFENISQAGPTMTVDIVKVAATPALDHYKIGYWVDDTTREGYRRKLFKRFDANVTPVMDFSEIIDGDSIATRIPLFLQAYYTTGEVRAHNHLASWSSDSPYVTVATDGQPFTNEGALMPSAISIVTYDTSASPSATATITVNTGANVGAFSMSNVPAP
jgi:M6 family metalloprotease-like protein